MLGKGKKSEDCELEEIAPVMWGFIPSVPRDGRYAKEKELIVYNSWTGVFNPPASRDVNTTAGCLTNGTRSDSYVLCVYIRSASNGT